MRRGDESGSVQSLLESVGEQGSSKRVAIPNARMNRSDTKACVCAMWSSYVRSEEYAGQASIAVLDSLVDEYGGAADLLVEYVERRRFDEEDSGRYSSLANRVLLVNEETQQDEDMVRAFMEAHRDMLLLPEGTVGSESSANPVELVNRREELLSARVNEFFELMMAWEYVSFAPVELA